MFIFVHPKKFGKSLTQFESYFVETTNGATRQMWRFVWVLPTQVEDPNNLGVILRTMEAFGSRKDPVVDSTKLAKKNVWDLGVTRCDLML